MIPILILPEASEELEASVLRYDARQAGLGSAFLVEFKKTRERNGELPKAGRTLRGEIRRRPIHRFPYSILYRESETEIIIVAVAHRRRRPGYWHGRT